MDFFSLNFPYKVLLSGLAILSVYLLYAVTASASSRAVSTRVCERSLVKAERIQRRMPVRRFARLMSQLINQGVIKTLVQSNEVIVVYAKGSDLPKKIMDEIGIFREREFRKVGEGSLKSKDLDRFDPNYYHIMMLPTDMKRFWGLYRVGLTSELLVNEDLSQLYSNEQYRFKIALFKKLGVRNGVEVGRSVVASDQKGRLPFLLSGIGEFIAQHPEVRYLFGPVSISTQLPEVLQAAILDYFFTKFKDPLSLSDDLNPVTGIDHLKEAFTSSQFAEYQQEYQNLSVGQFGKWFETRNDSGIPFPELVKHYHAFFAANSVAADHDPSFGTVDILIFSFLMNMDSRMANRFSPGNGEEIVKRNIPFLEEAMNKSGD